MADSDVAIVNTAFRLIGAQPITSLGDDSDRARLANGLYKVTRDAVLRAHPWNFALRRRTLAKNATGPDWGYTNAFTLPTDPYCLRVLRLKDDEFPDVTWKIEGRDLVTDQGEAKILYIARIENPPSHDSLFDAALSARLASDMAYSLTGGAERAKLFFEIYKMKLGEARSIDGQEGILDPFVANDIVDVRL